MEGRVSGYEAMSQKPKKTIPKASHLFQLSPDRDYYSSQYSCQDRVIGLEKEIIDRKIGLAQGRRLRGDMKDPTTAKRVWVRP